MREELERMKAEQLRKEEERKRLMAKQLA